MRVTGVDWSLDVRYREKSFSGKVSIGLEGASDPLIVDASRLTIHSAAIDGRPAPYRADEVRGILEFPGVSSAPHRLDIEYAGAADPNSLVGLYVSPSGPGYVLTTMLFPTGSRRLLPTFEHPAMKTVYRLTLSVDSGVHVIFNAPPRSEAQVDGRRVVTFEPTPSMSAYLIYLGIGPFDTLTIPGDRWSVTVAASPGNAHAGKFSAERATEILAAYEEYYSVPYPLPKLDLVGLEAFWAGAMENWGAISFREDALLVDSTTSVRARRQVLLVLAHEIAHQWFGNLVTAAWWDDFWLNESFATFVGYRTTHQLYPEEDAWSDFLLRWVDPAFEEDARSAAHPVHVPVDTPEQLGENADAITYGKGAAILRMIESHLGDETFRRGVSNYLAEHRYANARSQDLWEALGRAAKESVGRIMAEWIDRAGHPIVHAHWDSGRLTLRQERFRADGAPSPGIWPIPLRIASPEGEVQRLFETPEIALPLSRIQGLRIDPGRKSFARTHYDAPLFAQMVQEFPSMAPVDQWGLVVDTAAFVYAQLVTIDQFLDLVRAAEGLTEALPVRSIVAALSDMYGALYDAPPFVSAMQRFLRVQLEKVGIDGHENEPDSQQLLREVIASVRARTDPEFARALAPRFADFERLAPELRRPVAIGFASAGGLDGVEPLVTRLRTTTSQSERVHMVHGLGALRDPTLVRPTLALAINGDLTAGVGAELIAVTSTQPSSRSELFGWYRDHVQTFAETLAGSPLHSVTLRAILPRMGIDQEDAVVEYFAQHTPVDVQRAVHEGLEALRLAMRLRRQVRDGPAR